MQSSRKCDLSTSLKKIKKTKEEEYEVKEETRKFS